MEAPAGAPATGQGMKRLAACVVMFLCAGCLGPVTEERAEQAWENCVDPNALTDRVAACSTVISFDGSARERRVQALTTRGSIRAEQGDFARGLADFGRALRLDPNYAEAYLQRGLAHQARGGYDAAIHDFDFALTLQPALERAIALRDEALRLRGEDVFAQLESLNVALRETPTNSELLNNRCWIRAVNGIDLELALADCNAALSANPANAAARDSRGLVYLKMQNHAAALQDYEAALASEPQRGHFIYGRGIARLWLGDAQQAARDLAEAEQLEPGVTALYQSYGISAGVTPPAPG